MGRTVLLTLPWPPSTNKIWRAVGGRIISSKIARVFYRRAAAALPTGHVQPLTGRLVVWMMLHPPEGFTKVWDIANREKAAADSLTRQRVWLDDSQIDTFVIMRGEPRGAGCAEIMIKEIM